MEIELMDVILGVGGLLVANLGVKLGRAAGILKKGFKFIENHHEAKKDGILNLKEKLLLNLHLYFQLSINFLLVKVIR